MDEQLKMFRVLAPEFSALADDTVKGMMEIARPFVSQKRFADLYNQAVALYTAHLFAWNNLIADYGSVSAAASAGTVTQAKEGDLMMQYSNTNRREVDDLDKTAYGIRYKTLCKIRRGAGVMREGIGDVKTSPGY